LAVHRGDQLLKGGMERRAEQLCAMAPIFVALLPLFPRAPVVRLPRKDAVVARVAITPTRATSAPAT
jgi:hypothetical protein